jgi:conjugal transfer pilus assembly protein TraW
MMTDTAPSRSHDLSLPRTAIAVLLAPALIASGAARAETATIGRTWPIAEPDALAEIEARAATLPRDMAPSFGPRANWSAMKAARLGTVKTAGRRIVVPFYTLDMDVTLPDGRVLYPRGYTFNPLAYVSLPQALVVVHAAELDWALKTAAPTDWILLAGSAGDEAPGDPITLGEKAGRPLFILEDRVRERLGLTVAPVIVRQVGQKLELAEMLVHGRGARP